MTQVQARPARAATSPSDVPARATPPADRPGRGRVGPVLVGQLVLLELCAVAVWASTTGPSWLLAAVGTVAALVVLAAFARRAGRWWFEDLLLRRRLRRRRERATAALADGSAADPRLAALAPELSVIELTDRGTRLGIGQDDNGWFAAIALQSGTGTAVGSVEASTVDRALAVLADFAAPVSGTQVVAHTLVWYPAPGAAPAAHRTVWVALRLTVRDARVEAVSRGGGLAGVHRTLAAGIGRLGKALTAAGLSHRPLGRDELRSAVVSAAGLDLVPEPPTETWQGLRGGGWTHRCMALRGRPDAPLGPLVDAVTATSAPSHTVAVSVSADGRMAAPLLRVAAMDNHVEALVKVVREVAGRAGASARPVDGQHGPGVYASAPVGSMLGVSTRPPAR
ncbi:type VII secretion protein EccE [Micromonospora sp. ALFpr18c]|uniref:type VII secretion protein EccE n=1 Tax=unclassified Micromonospora TaxID=2617518 RepID=UPI00124B0E5E|nr:MULTISPECIES: type VII secretion protein EccE [unclassified Micromonospora]KAB1948408.1 type VII secretion protein EccE [Micromonospora sp. ALFpr18c]MDG4760621.1 type VII secretion protein EccE [Micromonospora sp. WMMD710]